MVFQQPWYGFVPGGLVMSVLGCRAKVASSSPMQNIIIFFQGYMWGSVPHIKLFLIQEKLILNLHCATSWQLWNIPIG